MKGLTSGKLYRYLFRAHRKDLGRWVEVPDPKATMDHVRSVLDASGLIARMTAGGSGPRMTIDLDGISIWPAV